MSNQATTDHGKAASGKGSDKNGPPAGAASAKLMDSRFTEVGADRFMFNPNQGCTGRLVGYLINQEEMPEIERGSTKQEWKCFLILTTEACKGIGRDKAIHDVPPGSEVLVPGTFKLNDVFTNAANDPNECYEVCIIPKEKISIGSGQTMWLYTLGVDKKTVKPRKEFGLAAKLTGAPAVKALTAGGAETAGTDGESIPF